MNCPIQFKNLSRILDKKAADKRFFYVRMIRMTLKIDIGKFLFCVDFDLCSRAIWFCEYIKIGTLDESFIDLDKYC